MVSKYCEINLSDPKFDKLSKTDKEQISKDIDRIIERAARNASIEDIASKVEMELNDYLELVDRAELVKKVNSYRNLLAREKMYEIMTGPFKANPSEGLMAFMVGSQVEGFGSRLSVSRIMEGYQQRYTNSLQKLLVNDGLDKAFSSGKFDLEIRVAASRLDAKMDVSDLPEIAVAIAKHLQTVNKIMLKDANSMGAVIGSLDGYVTRQGHNMHKIRAKKEAWKNFMRTELDTDRSNFGKINFEDELEKQWSEFSSGIHIKEIVKEDPGKGLTGFASLAKSMSKNRDIIFKSPEAEFRYAKEFGEGSLFDDVIVNYSSTGRKVGMLSALGPNPLMNIEMIVKQLSDELNKLGKPDEVLKLNKNLDYVKNVVFPVLTGASSIPGNEIAATAETIVAKTLRMSKLGSASIASLVGEPVMNGLNLSFLEGNTLSFFKGVTESFSKLKPFIKKPEVQEFLEDYRVQLSYLNHSLNHRNLEDIVSPLNNIERTTDRLENFFFKMTGMNALDRTWRYAASMGFAKRLAMNSDKVFDDLPDSYKRVLSNSGIDAADWNMVRGIKKDFGGDIGELIGIEQIRTSDMLGPYVKSKGFKDTPFQRNRLAEDLINKVTSMLNDYQSYSVISADARLRAAMYGGMKRGSTQSVIFRQLMLLKSWPLAYMQSTFGRTFYRNDPLMTKVANTVGIMIAMTASGYLLTQITELRKGREPLPLNTQTMLSSFARGGGLGLYGDFVYSVAEESMGKDALYKLAGPAAQLAGDSIDVVQELFAGEDSKFSEKAFKLIKSNVPFANHFFVKPVADYLLLNAMTEVISPGALERAELRQMKRTGTDYIFGKPSETMLFK